jgi:hypothetical protein
VPIVIPKLVDICRKVVNQILNQPVYELNLPKELKKFLVYDDIRDEAIASSGSPQQINHSPTVAANTTINTSRGSNFIIQGTTVCN